MPGACRAHGPATCFSMASLKRTGTLWLIPARGNPSREVEMCHVRNSTWTNDRTKQELKERQDAQEKRAGLIGHLLSGAEKAAPASEKPPVKETVPAK